MKKYSKLNNIRSLFVGSAPYLRGRARGEAVLCLLFSLLFALTSCSDSEEGEYTLTNSIRIVSQNVSDMDVKASEGTIVVEAPSSIEATASSDWFTTSISGKTITVKTTDNLGIEYRTGKVVIKSGSDVAEIAVIQKGTIISVDAKELYLDDSQAELEIPYTTNLDFNCQTTEDWITCKAENGILKISTSENATGHMRSGFVYYEAGSTKDSIYVQQCEVEKDLLGEMMFVYYDAKLGDYNALNAEFVSSTDSAGIVSYALVLNDLGFVIPVGFNKETNTITLNAGLNIGKFQEYEIYTTLYDYESDKVIIDNKIAISGSFSYDKDDKATYLTFDDSDKFDEFNITSLFLSAYDAQGNPIGTLQYLHFPYLMK